MQIRFEQFQNLISCVTVDKLHLWECCCVNDELFDHSLRIKFILNLKNGWQEHDDHFCCSVSLKGKN